MTNFSWQMGQTELVLSPSSGTGMYWTLGSDDEAAPADEDSEAPAPLLGPPAPSASAWWSRSTASRDLIQS